ncbi:TPA: tail fiber assembly protein [Proteus mirabilis]|uniref:tail fiber assembly protein n=1 Tax=Proteus mirabilis TaxID=584 RepID=UPI0006686B2D|nr:tail fiber assembly protein [Proteus mirabilis]ELA7681223.1 tail fiber assembly protein [Proteus mirabilis]ELB0939141.1 tail fiber assembly protein [Proteus mirabilis]ELN4246533.1 tail fiber assembly protein [Proteus mirabilis]ELN4570206.1 tail fiber assembly protein [Proteus mirabilis]MBB6651137.1 tail fiber assembly protein [Proteus mirabilis]
MYYFSAKENSFYPEEIKDIYISTGSFPGDVILVDDSVFNEFAANLPPEGKMRGVKDGFPVWIDIPPLAQSELSSIAEQCKIKLINEVTNIIAPMADALNGGYIDDKDIRRLDKWQRYRYELTKINISLAPDIEWPQKPE